MRVINIAHLRCPDDWDEKAAKAKRVVKEGRKTVNAQCKIWQKLKDALAECSYNKCWYCEIKQERSDNTVDHFRPKSLYPWLAFDKSNFRYSCTYCNSRRTNPETGETEGKGDVFPLLDGTPRATEEGQEANESPLLLDPCMAQDPGLLDFLENGRPCPKYPDHPIRKLRAETSIQLYHLDHPDLVEKRRVLAADLKESIKKAERLFPRCDTGDPAINDAFHAIIIQLHDAMTDEAELATFARKFIAGFRDQEWVEELLFTT